MSIIDHPAPHPAIGVSLGVPGTDSRWQPTRAGVVNSWAWASEDLIFADGWLTLAGPNGSGKSLTASMLVTVLLDADTSQTALSVSGKAAGTLTSRHTDWNDREDRTGAWWLEYGLRDPDTGQVTFLTTGLWLRATGGHLHRAFFLVPGRVGHDLLLQRDREPVRIEDLAGQLAACGGELFTASTSLRTKALAHLPALEDERGYRQAIRTRLFAPLDEVQFDALLAVLRSLRSLRTAEAISPTRMRQVLTDALPALDTDSLTLIAEAMERIAELETQLQRTREEAKLLEGTDRAYRRYLAAAAQTQTGDPAATHPRGSQTAGRHRPGLPPLPGGSRPDPGRRTDRGEHRIRRPDPQNPRSNRPTPDRPSRPGRNRPGTHRHPGADRRTRGPSRGGCQRTARPRRSRPAPPGNPSRRPGQSRRRGRRTSRTGRC